MFISPKRLIRTKNGKIVPAGPGISGSLVAAEGAEISEELAVELGLMKSLRDARPATKTQPVQHAGQKAALQFVSLNQPAPKPAVAAAPPPEVEKPWDVPQEPLTPNPAVKVDEDDKPGAPLPK